MGSLAKSSKDQITSIAVAASSTPVITASTLSTLASQAQASSAGNAAAGSGNNNPGTNENIGLGSYNYGGLIRPGAFDSAEATAANKYSHRDSDCTAYTSATEVRERGSVATVIRGSN
jgi:hypothetical protein